MDKIFKEKLYDMETPLGERVSFDKVMRRRKSPQWPVWWKPAVLVVATMSVVSLTGYFWISDNQNPASSGNSVVAAAENGGNSKTAQTDAWISTPMESEASNENSSIETAGLSKNQGIQRMLQRSGQAPVQAMPEAGGESSAAVGENNSNTDHSGLKSFSIRFAQLFGADLGRKSLKNRVKDYEKEPLIPTPAFELMFATGSKNIAAVTNAPYSIGGNQYFGQYSAIALWDAGRGFKFGIGAGFSQYKGFGEWNSLTTQNLLRIDTQYITVIQPGLPPETIVVIDTAIEQVQVRSKGDINYTVNKTTIPLAFRYYMGEGRMLYRINATLAPGILTRSNGSIFNNTKQQEISGSSKSFTMDARLAFGVEMLMSRKFSLIIEPGLNYQMTAGDVWKGFGQLHKGLGIGLIFKP